MQCHSPPLYFHMPNPNPSFPEAMASSHSDPKPKARRGRPRGTGRKQRLAPLCELMNTSAGDAYAPHVITVEPGEDIVSKLLSFSKERPRAVCIISAIGKVSSVTFCKPGTSEHSKCFPGSYDILKLQGSYLVDQVNKENRTGHICVSLSNCNGSVIGGVAGKLIASTPVQVVAGSFVYNKAKAKAKVSKLEDGSRQDINNRLEMIPMNEPPSPPTVTESAVEAAQMSLDFFSSSPGEWSGFGGSNGTIDLSNHNNTSEIDLLDLYYITSPTEIS